MKPIGFGKKCQDNSIGKGQFLKNNSAGKIIYAYDEKEENLNSYFILYTKIKLKMHHRPICVC